MEHEQAHHVRFDKTINLGHVITTVAILLSMVIAWEKMDSRLMAVETQAIQDHIIIAELQRNTTKLTTLAEIYVPKINMLLDDVPKSPK